MKLSLHGGGICQMGFTQEFWSKREKEGEFSGPRQPAARWTRRLPAPGQIIQAAVLQFPTDFLIDAQPIETTRQGKKRFIFQPAQPGRCFQVGLFFGHAIQPNDELTLEGWHNLFWVDLPNNEVSICAVRYAKLDKGFLPSWSEISTRPPIWSSKDLNTMVAGERREGMSMCLHSNPEDGEPITICEINGVSLTKN